ncbi:uncharacterized protein METZ01_LOCUS127444 [marine metagenome]|uniref:Uncharacterized protein n=1 Tax=marine metagenome TaxID=408172 RepID=A0A381YCJ5_9ZZZZ
MYEPFSASKKTFHFLLNLITSLFLLFYFLLLFSAAEPTGTVFVVFTWRTFVYSI